MCSTYTVDVAKCEKDSRGVAVKANAGKFMGEWLPYSACDCPCGCAVGTYKCPIAWNCCKCTVVPYAPSLVLLRVPLRSSPARPLNHPLTLLILAPNSQMDDRRRFVVRHTNARTRVLILVHTHTHTRTHTHTHTYIHIHTHTHKHAFSCTLRRDSERSRRQG